MKKLIILLIITLLTGCYDYKEINNLALVSAIGIDHDGENFLITYEILNDNQSGDQNASASAYTINGEGQTIAQGFDNMALKISKIPYYNHLHAVVISQKVAENHFKELMDYIVRQPTIRNEFYLVLSQYPSQILDNSSEEHPVVGSQIMDLINAGENNYNSAYPMLFEDIVENTLNPNKEPIINVIALEDNEITLKGIALFKDYTYVDIIVGNDAALIISLMGKNHKIILNKKYNDLPVTIKTFKTDVKTEIKDKEIIIFLSAYGELEENTPSFDLTHEETFKKLNKDFSSELKVQAQDALNKCLKLDTDILGLRDIYYKKYRKTNNNLLKEYNITVNATLKVNKRGLIYEVPNES